MVTNVNTNVTHYSFRDNCFVCPAVTPSAQLLEQTARLQSLSDTLGRLKVNTSSHLRWTNKYSAKIQLNWNILPHISSLSGWSSRARRQPPARSSSLVWFCNVPFDHVCQGECSYRQTVTAHHLFIFLRVHRGRGVTQDSGDSPHSTLAQLI